MFHNPEIALEELPSADDVDWQALHPDYVQRIRLQVIIVVAFIGVAITALNLVPGIPLLVFVALYTLLAIFAIFLFMWPGIAIPRQGYAVRARDILFRKGVIWRSVTAVPFNRIQHVETSSTPLDRKYSLATLQLFTAGGSSGDLKINGLDKKVAEELRVFILGKVGNIVENA
ncbi:MAG: PH domain-containing protein [Gammaproteobacteria bacterium]|nr:PH domain-containing protein [Gammaproteobacteria bacterium]MBU2677763.1 PH domain-containing protein [Gammaproteobacteria bacterium]NNL51496.1 PH domain-containing protein [Woeseiaceae bacterium]